MILDFLIVPPIILTSLLGLRDGVVRKVASIAGTVGALFLGQVFMHQAGVFFIENLGTEQSSAPIHGFLSIFFLILLSQSLIYHLVAKDYKIGGVLDRVAGAVLGFFQGVLFMSCLLWIYSLEGIPSAKTARQSEFYKPVVNVAPQVLDMFTNVSAETEEFLKERATPTTPDGLGRPARRDTSKAR